MIHEVLFLLICSHFEEIALKASIRSPQGQNVQL